MTKASIFWARRSRGRNNSPEAAACFRAAIRANPGYASALNDLGWLLATCPDAQVRNVPEAIRCAQARVRTHRQRGPHAPGHARRGAIGSRSNSPKRAP